MIKRDRFSWTETDNEALVELLTIDSDTIAMIIRDFGNYQCISISESTGNECRKSMFATDLEAFNRKIPFFTEDLTNNYLRLTFTETGDKL